MNVYRDGGADLKALQGKTVAIIGYGSQGHAHADNLRDSGVNVVVGLRRDGQSWPKAVAAGLEVTETAEAARRGDIIMMVMPDELGGELYEQDVAPGLRAGKYLEKKFGRTVRTETDLRRVFDDKSIDVVSVATPNHWHALATIWACQAGKDVYVEKPGSHNIFEGRKMIEAAARYDRIVQHGVQLRSSLALQEAVRKMREGVIGKVYMGRAIIYRWRPTIGHFNDEPVPEGLDYDVWLGPAPYRPFSHRHVHYNWHWQWDFGNGEIGNQGVHETDMCLWGLDVQFPRHITSSGGKFLWDDDKQTPEILTSSYLFPDQKKTMEVEVRHWFTNQEDGAAVGNIFYGTEGYLVIKNYDTYETWLGPKREPGPARKAGGDHYGNFISAVRSRKKGEQNGPIETGHYAAGIAHLGNIAYRLNRHLEFDPATEKFVNDAEADKMLRRDYRAPFVVPEQV